MSLIADAITGGLTISGLYLLIALAWVVIFRGAHLFNFATGEFLLLGGTIAAFLIEGGTNYWAAIALALLATGTVGALTYIIFLRRHSAELFVSVIVTLGVAIMVRQVMHVIFGPGARQLPTPFENQNILVGPAFQTSTNQLVIIGAGLVAYLALMSIERWSNLGLDTRATNENPLLAAQSGVNIYVLFAAVFAVSAILASVAGIAQGQRALVHPSIVNLGLIGLVPAMVGGLDSIKGTLPGALIVGLTESFTIMYLGNQYRQLAVFTILLIVLGVRPQGLLGSTSVRRL